MPDFVDEIRAICEKNKKRMFDVARAATLELFKNIVTRTPVDTGRARANWQIEINAEPPQQSVNERNNPPEDKDDTARRKIAEITEKIDGADESVTKFILVNNLVYIKPLEYGHSKLQAPNGMVRISVAEFPDLLRHYARNRG